VSWILVDSATWNSVLAAITRIDKNVSTILAQQGTDSRLLQAVKTEEDQIMSALTDQLDALEKNTKAIDDSEDAAEAAFTRLAAMIADLKTGVTDPAVIARIDAVSSELAARASKLAAAVVATPT
jgi:septal ring factor EnvC (AmiA/AmiB activator)